VKSR